MTEKKALRIFVPERDELKGEIITLHNKELCGLYSWFYCTVWM